MLVRMTCKFVYVASILFSFTSTHSILNWLYCSDFFCIHMQDFATSSLHCEVAREDAVGLVPAALGEDLEQYQIVERRRWEHRYVMVLKFLLKLLHSFPMLLS